MNRYMRVFSICFGFGLIGVLMSAIIDILVTRGIVLDEYITGSITTPEVMAINIIVWLILGVIVAAKT